MIRFVCMHCDKALRADDAKAGATVKCPDCGRKLTVPAKEEGGPPTPAAANEKEDARPNMNAEVDLDKRTKPRRSRRTRKLRKFTNWLLTPFLYIGGIGLSPIRLVIPVLIVAILCAIPWLLPSPYYYTETKTETGKIVTNYDKKTGQPVESFLLEHGRPGRKAHVSVKSENGIEVSRVVDYDITWDADGEVTGVTYRDRRVRKGP